ncbi:MAG TPA: FMN-binding protein [Spirochaetia bacterium]|nr:FMN-binding protein [Spirochaetia bacterium]
MRKMIIVLTAVMVLSGLVLAATYTSLSPRIEANRVAALNASLASIFADQVADVADLEFEELDTDGPTVYRGSAGDGALLGYAVRVQTQGYGGTITMLAGVAPDLETILGIEVVEQIETPGLGGNITNESFKQQFEGLSTREPIEYVKNIEPSKADNEIQAISGATITTKAIVNGTNSTLDRAIEIIRRQVQ